MLWSTDRADGWDVCSVEIKKEKLSRFRFPSPIVVVVVVVVVLYYGGV